MSRQMKVMSFGDSACEKIRRYLDSYINNELTVETNHEVVRHLGSCLTCVGEFEERSRLKARLKSAVTTQNAPVDLSEKIREQIREQDSRRLASPRWARWGAVAAAVLLASLGT